MVSPRCAAWLGEVRSPISSAIFSELASIAAAARAGPRRPASLAWAPRCWRWTSMSRWTVTVRSQMKNGTSGVGLVVREPLQGVDVRLLQDVGRRDAAP